MRDIILLVDRVIKCGKNVTIYPNVMFFGDGKIEIGGNVDIGSSAIIYASKCRGYLYGSNTVMQPSVVISSTWIMV